MHIQIADAETFYGWYKRTARQVIGKILAEEVDINDYSAVVAVLSECVSRQPLQFWEKYHETIRDSTTQKTS